MKCVSLGSPHGLLTAYGFSTVITRETDTPHRGWVGLHVASYLADEVGRWTPVYPVTACLEMVDEIRRDKGWEPFLADPPPDGSPRPSMDYEDLPRGAIVGVAWLAKTERADALHERWHVQKHAWRLEDPDYNDVPKWEVSFGDFRKGRRAWWLCRPVPLRHPVPVVGTPGIWDTKDATARDIGGGPDRYEGAVLNDLLTQHVTLPDQFNPGFWRLINRRGTTEADRPKERV